MKKNIGKLKVLVIFLLLIIVSVTIIACDDTDGVTSETVASARDLSTETDSCITEPDGDHANEVSQMAYVVFSGGAQTSGYMPSQEIALGLFTLPECRYYHVDQRCSFIGWHSSADGNTYLPGDTVAILDTTPTVFTAIWSAPRYHVTIVEGVESTSRETVEVESKSFILPSPTPLEGYRFVSWEVTGSTTRYAPGDVLIVTGDIEVTARYEEIYYKISFSGNSGTGEMNAISVRHGDTITLPGSAYSRKYYCCNGWLYKGSMLAFGSEVTVKENMDLAANWVITTSAHWNAQDHLISYSALYTIDVSELLDLEELQRSGYTGYRIKLVQLTTPTEGRCDPGVDIYCAKPQSAGIAMDGFQAAEYSTKNRIIDTDDIGIVFNQTQTFYSDTLSLDQLLSSGGYIFVHQKARAAYPGDVGKNEYVATFTLYIEVF